MTIEQAQELRNSTAWDNVVKELSRMIDLDMAKLRTCTADELRRYQVRIETFEFIKNLPQTVIDREE